jgi:stage II sporulation protein P
MIIKVVLILVMIFNLPIFYVQEEAVASTVEEQDNVQNVSTKVSKNKSIYIYNTHQIEKYATNGVIEGGKYLMKLLENKGYDVVYETNDFEKYKTDNNINYKYSYTVSAKYTKQAIKENGNFDLLIDFHRDSVKRSATTLNYKDKSYAKLMFVVGKSSAHYPNTKENAEKLKTLLNKKVPNICRGVYLKKNQYNQGIADNMFLIEVGSQDNTYTEVKNSLAILADVIDSYLS